jgi:hypothetical protein
MAKTSTTSPAKIKPAPLKTDPILKETKPVFDADMSITIQLGTAEDELIILSASKVSKAKKEGMQFSMPKGKKVKIGSLKNLINGITDKTDPFDFSALKSVPKLQALVKNLMNAETSVTKFDLSIGPTPEGKESPSPEYEIELTTTVMDPDNPTVPKPFSFFGLFNVVEAGFVFKSKNQEVTDNKGLNPGEDNDAEDAEVIE